MARKKNQIDTLYDLVKLGPKKAIIILVIAGLAYFFGGESLFLNNENKSNDSGSQDFVSGVVVRAVDGDTAVIKVDGQERRVRLLGVDTPETVHPNKPVQFYGKEASRFTKDSLNGRRVWLEYDANPQDRYQRHLAYVWLENPKTINEASIRESMFNARLLLGGYAKVMIIKPNKRYEAEFRKFENEAKNAKRGLWNQ
ncbi:MAG: thermonuclease family protein [Synergistaceae bacterium]|nr:thermonuclease family protein [Synergistaceae bacterium]MBQ3764882.1 thermonuclease family protein [Synergistaceae bacterium]MBQ6969042.1 thermonuclease family protein [Synergistaceae bacterium]